MPKLSLHCAQLSGHAYWPCHHHVENKHQTRPVFSGEYRPIEDEIANRILSDISEEVSCVKRLQRETDSLSLTQGSEASLDMKRKGFERKQAQ